MVLERELQQVYPQAGRYEHSAASLLRSLLARIFVPKLGGDLQQTAPAGRRSGL